MDHSSTRGFESPDALQAWIVGWLGEHLQVPSSAIKLDARLRDLGLDSGRATRLVAALSDRLDRPLPLTLLWDRPTVLELVRHLTQPEPVPALDAPARVESRSGAPGRSIAVVAMACRFPGGADTPDAYWNLLAQGRDVVTPVPPDRFDAEAYYDRDPQARGKAVTRWGGFLDRTDAFDPLFFGISPREAVEMDPQQRLVLELAWEAFEAAGVPKPALRDRAVGVFIGAMWNDYARLWRGGPRAIEQFTATGQDDSIIAARVSYVFGLRGPSLTLNTACSSSLVAVHLACQSLLTGDSELALAGGVNLIFGPDSTIAMSKFGGMARDGRCKAFDARGDGYVRGEGAGLVLLKPLDRALEDGDPIHAIIRGSAINNDGFSNGLTSPSPAAQAAMLRAAYATAEVSPARVHYVEAHGTGTMLGDPIEAGALGEVLGRHPDRRQPLRIGSAKTNIGHLEAAAGMAGLIKTIEALKHRRLPASLHFERPNPNIDFTGLRLEVQADFTPWPGDDDALLAGVSSFGFGGTNAHVVLESFQPPRPVVLPVAAHDPEVLAARTRALAAFVAQHPGASLDDVQRSWIEVLEPAPVRRAIVARSRGELVAQLTEAAPERPVVPAAEDPRPVFVFTGNGSQWPGMARDLMQQDAAFRQVIVRCDELLRREGCDGVERALRLGEFDTQRVDLVQPLLWAIQVGLVTLWRSWGVDPSAVVGHSVGEIAAAWTAGALELDEAARVVVYRSRLQQECADRGGMVMLETDAAGARAVVAAAEAASGRPSDGLAIAALNSPRNVVVSGSAAGLAAVIAKAAEFGVPARTVRVNVAYHGPQMTGLGERLRLALGDLAPCAPRIPMISTVTGQPVGGARLDADYWVRNMCDPVRFGDAIRLLGERGSRLHLEIGPHPTLARAVQEQLGQDGQGDAGFVATSLARDEASRHRLLEAAARLYERGAVVAWPALRSERAEVLPIRLEPPPARIEPVAMRGGAPRQVLLALSGHNAEALQQRMSALHQHLVRHPDTDPEALARTLGRGRSHLSHRRALVVSSTSELIEILGRAGDGTAPEVIGPPAALAGPVKIAFVFPGQGTQWLGMGRQLLDSEPVFRKAIQRWEPVLAEFTDWSLIDQLHADARASRLDQVDVIQPMLFAVQVALAELWRSWGVAPDAVIGHSMGEVAGAFVAGALSARDAARIICLRSRIARQTSGRGAMAMVELSPDECRQAVAGHASTVSVAACNGPTSCLLSGDGAALEAIGGELQARGVFFRPVKVDYASHSPQMDAVKDELARALADTRPRPPTLPFHSTVDGAIVDDARMDAAYWARNLREPVLFFQGIQNLEARGCNVFLEISPHPVLTYSIAKTVHPDRAVILGSLKRDEDERRALLSSLGTLFAAGGSADWSALSPGALAPIELPSYPFQRERCWFIPEAGGWSGAARTGGQAFLDRFTRSPFPQERLIWEIDLSLERFPYLADHRVGGLAVFPGTGYLECVLEAARELYGDAAVELSQVAFEKALFLDDTGTKTLQLSMEPDTAGHRFSLASYDAGLAAWTRHVAGLLVRAREDAAGGPTEDAWSGGAPETVEVAAFYRNLDRAGNTYRARFQAVQQLQRGAEQVRGHVLLGEALSTRGVRVHPVLFDACLQVMATPLAVGRRSGDRESAFMPTRVERIRVFADAGTAAISRVRYLDGMVVDPATGDLHADLDITDEQGRLLIRIERMCFHLLEHATAAARPSSDLLYRLAWQDAAPLPVAATPARRWLVFDDGPVAAAAAGCLRSPHVVHRIRPADEFRRDGDDFYLRPDEPGDYVTLLRALSETRGALPLAILHLWNLRIPQGEIMSPGHLRDLAKLGCLSVTHTLNALAEHSRGAPPRIWIATRGAWAISETEHDLAPAHAAVWGLTRAVAQEYPAHWGGIVDLDPRDELAAQAERLIAEASAPDPDEDRIVYRRHQRQAVRLVRAPELGRAAAPGFRSDRGYLITGGLGALGLRLAAWMVAHGARHLILLGRKPLPHRGTWKHAGHDPSTRSKIDAVLGLERLGTSVFTPALDIGDGDALAHFLDTYEQEARPTIAGVAHLAGVIRPELLAALREPALDEAFRSKVHGAWNLHRAFAPRPLDFFALFSSASAILNSPLLGSYAAANAFLDGLAQFRRARGEPAQTFNWGFWGEAGMAARDLAFDTKGADSQGGMRSFSPATGLEIFGGLLARDPVQSIVMDVDWASWLATYPDAARSPLLRTLRGDTSSGVATERAAVPGQAVQDLRTLPAAELRNAIVGILLDELSAVLKVPTSKIAPTTLFGAMGLDSMLSLELRNRLERRTGLTLPGTLVWNYPSVDRMTGFFVEKLGEAPAGVPILQIESAGAPTGDDDAPPSDEMIEILRQLGVITDDDPVLHDPVALRSLVRDTEALLNA